MNFRIIFYMILEECVKINLKRINLYWIIEVKVKKKYILYYKCNNKEEIKGVLLCFLNYFRNIFW